MNDNMNSEIFKSLQGYKDSYKEVFRIVSGSHLYGLSLPTSDIDYRGVFMSDPKTHFFRQVEQISDKKSDTVYYEFHRLIELLKNANPNLLELLYAPDDKCEFITPEMRVIRDNRQMFMSQKAYHSFSGYAYSQIHKAKSNNKMWHLTEKFGDKVESPKLIDYCYALAQDNGKPWPISQSRLDLSKYKAAKVEHNHNWYRLYESDDNERGVIKDEQIACKSVSLDEEANFRCLMFVNYDSFEDDKKGHAQYWEWFRNRNVERWKDQLGGQIDFDCKNMGHCIRLLMSCLNIMNTGEPQIVFDGADRDLILSIRKGDMKYEDILALANDLMKRCEDALKTTKLPYGIDQVKIDNLLYEIYQEHWKNT